MISGTIIIYESNEYESDGDKNRNLSVDEYPNKIDGKIHLTIALNFISSKGVEEESVMLSMSNTLKFASDNGTKEVANELFESLHSRYQGKLETSMRGNYFIFDSVQLMYFKYHKVNFRRGGSYIDSTDGIKKKNAKINPKKYRQ